MTEMDRIEREKKVKEKDNKLKIMLERVRFI
jgi:hypothetical protein